MKKIVSTKGYQDGIFDCQTVNTALSERVNPKLECYYNQNSPDGNIHVQSNFSYLVFNGEVAALHLSYTVANPTHDRLEWFRDICNSFYEVSGFRIGSDESSSPCVFFHATDIYDMATLIHALDYQSVCLEPIICPIDVELTETDAIYSPSGTYILQIPDIPDYRVKEGTLFVAPRAFLHCSQLRHLDLPMSIIEYEKVVAKYPYPLEVVEWDTHYNGTTDEPEPDEDEKFYIDEHDVRYTKDKRKLICCSVTFKDVRYEVPDGVEEIDDYAFLTCRHYLVVSIPRSVKVIGDNLFGCGGQIIVRETE